MLKSMSTQTRDKYEQECLKIKGYLAQGHMVMGQEERKNKAKLEKTQITLATTNAEYEAAVKALEETTARWNREWKAAADKFQDLEEERLDFTKNSLWTFANIASTVCVSDDASCEKIRLSLEKMEVEKDILHFIKERGTGQEIPDPPKYINFCRGDVDSQSEASAEDDAYSVAQFPRSINPAFRSSSPQPSTYESHHDPNSALARDMVKLDIQAPTGRELPVTAAVVPPMPQPERERPRQQPPSGYQPPRANLEYDPNEFAPIPHNPYPEDGMTMFCRKTARPDENSVSHRQTKSDMSNNFRSSGSEMGPPLQKTVSNMSNQFRTSGSELSMNNPLRPTGSDLSTSSSYRPTPTSSEVSYRPAGSDLSSQRPSSRDSHSDYSNPTSFSSHEPAPTQNQAVAPVRAADPTTPTDKKVLKKKSGFFSNNSPFARKKSMREVAPSSRNTWHPGNTNANTAANNRDAAPPQSFNNSRPSYGRDRGNSSTNTLLPENKISRTASPDPIDANATLALNVGNNVFPVSTADRGPKPAADALPEDDPIALALAELKGVTGASSSVRGKEATSRMSADAYAGISTPAPNAREQQDAQPLFSRPGGKPAPPSYNDRPATATLGVPPPAVTSKAMKEASRSYTEQTRSMFSSPQSRPDNRTYNSGSSTTVRPESRSYNSNQSTSGAGSARTRHDIPRAASPAPPRAASPRPGSRADPQGQPQYNTQPSHARSASPNPYARSASPAPPPSNSNMYGSTSSRNGGNTTPGRPPTAHRGSDAGYYSSSMNNRHASPGIDRSASPAVASPGYRSASPAPYATGSVRGEFGGRPGSSATEEGSMRGRGVPMQRPGTSNSYRPGGMSSSLGGGAGGQMGLYEPPGQVSRARSKSVADGRQFTRDGRPIMHYGMVSDILHPPSYQDVVVMDVLLTSGQRGLCTCTRLLYRRSWALQRAMSSLC